MGGYDSSYARTPHPENTGMIAEYQRAAATGHAQALYELGLIYALGKDVEIDYVEAHKWFNLAALLGVHEAQTDRAELAEQMSTSEIAHAQRLARAWLAEGNRA
jgi:TPR repeat protein